MNAENKSSSNTLDPVLFWGCFIALVTCAFGFIVRTQVIGDWQTELNLSNTQVGELNGVGFWPFAFSIIIFSLFIDIPRTRISAAFAFMCWDFLAPRTRLLHFGDLYPEIIRIGRLM